MRRGDKVAAIAISGGEFESDQRLAARDATLEEVFGAPELKVLSGALELSVKTKYSMSRYSSANLISLLLLASRC